MLLTRLQAVMVLGNGLVVGCLCGWLIWRTGGVSSRGRPLHTVHALSDTAGAVRRLTQPHPGSPPCGAPLMGGAHEPP
jgi:hypothetical protein